MRGVTRWLVPLGLLLSAFAPLALSLAVILARPWGAWWAGALGACVAALTAGFLLLVLRAVKRLQVHLIEPSSVRPKDRDVLSFYSSWVVPVAVGVLATDPVQAALALALALLLAVIYVRARLFYLNPVLALLGFRLYEVTVTNGVQVMLLSRRAHVGQADPLRVTYIGDTCVIDRHTSSRARRATTVTGPGVTTSHHPPGGEP